MDDDTRNTQGATDVIDLESLQRKAIEVLAPLVDQIDGAPENRFEILIMAARSSNDGALLNQALQVAQEIESPAAKANAVLDVLNEVNYLLSRKEQS
jgi:hypothetical protein